MSQSKKDNQVTVPQYNSPSPSGFQSPWGNVNYSGGNYNLTLSPEEQQTWNMASGIRKDLLSSLGLGGQPQEDPWAQLLLKESLRTTQPALENALIGRGLGGSSVYGQAISDLFSKLGTQATLGSQQYKIGNLEALQNYFSGTQSAGQNLLGLTSQNNIANQQLAQLQYLALLPLLAKYNSGQNSGGWGSALSGAASGAAAGSAFGPWGTGIGAVLGGAGGYFGGGAF